MEESQLQLAFRSDEKLPFKLYFLAKNQTASERKWKLMYFFDYKNTFVDVAGKEATAHDLVLAAGATDTFTLVFPASSPGFHDVLVLGIPMEEDNPYTFAYRANLIVGGDEGIPMQVFENVENRSKAGNKYSRFIINDTEDPGSFEESLTTKHDPLYLHMQNGNIEPCAYFVTIFKNGSPIRSEFVKLEGKTVGSISIGTEEGRYLAVTVEQPFVRLEDKGSIARSPSNVTFSNVVTRKNDKDS